MIQLLFGNGWVVVVVVMGAGGRVDVKFEHLYKGGGLLTSNKCEQGERGSKFCSFCEKVMIKCPQEKYRYVREKMPAQFKYP